MKGEAWPLKGLFRPFTSAKGYADFGITRQGLKMSPARACRALASAGEGAESGALMKGSLAEIPV